VEDALFFLYDAYAPSLSFYDVCESPCADVEDEAAREVLLAKMHHYKSA